MSEKPTIPPALPPRPKEGHKGLFGRVLVVGGNDEMIGAPAFAGTAALRAGAGLVQLATPRSILSAVLSVAPECIGLALDQSTGSAALRAAAASADAIVIGPGLGKSRDAKGWLDCLIRLKKPMVIDADGLNLLSDRKRWPTAFAASAVLTPHPGEMKRLGKLLGATNVPEDDAGRAALARRAARAFRQVVVLKGYRTVIVDGSHLHVNHTGDSSLSKAGSGDVLCGILATFLAQGMSRFDAACAAVYIHGRSGEIAGRRFGMRSVLARDVCDAIPSALREYEGDVRC